MSIRLRNCCVATFDGRAKVFSGSKARVLAATACLQATWGLIRTAAISAGTSWLEHVRGFRNLPRSMRRTHKEESAPCVGVVRDVDLKRRVHLSI